MRALLLLLFLDAVVRLLLDLVVLWMAWVFSFVRLTCSCILCIHTGTQTVGMNRLFVGGELDNTTCKCTDGFEERGCYATRAVFNRARVVVAVSSDTDQRDRPIHTHTHTLSLAQSQSRTTRSFFRFCFLDVSPPAENAQNNGVSPKGE